MEYPYSASFILTDTIFLAYGGDNGGSTAAQRAAAYLIAERQMTEHIGTFLKPTNITGTYFWYTADPLELEYGYVHSINGVTLKDAENILYTYTASDISKYVLLRNWKAGYVDILLTPTGWVHCNPVFPYTLEVSWNCGLPVSVASQPDLLLALTLGAQIILNEIDHLNLSNEGVADIGIQEFSNSFYHEIRTKLGRSAFGSSTTANMITRIINHLRSKNALKFH